MAATAGQDPVLRLPERLRGSLLGFQKEGVRFGWCQGGRCLIADEMGLGKTVQAIALARLFRHEWPLLVIAPPSMKLAWADELEKWLPDMDASCVHMVAHGKDLGRISTASITIVSYALLTQPAMQRAVLARKFQVVIADEAHMLKNRKAKRTRAVVPALKAAKRAILLTGTPALARPEELYVLLSALHPRRWGTFTAFATRYCDRRFKPWLRVWDTSGHSNLGELHDRLKAVMIRRLKCDVLTELPAKRRQRLVLELPSKSQNALRERLLELRSLCKDLPDDCDPWESRGRMRTLCSQLYRESGLAKAPAVRQYVRALIRGGAKFLVFAHHLDVLAEVEAAVAAERVKYIKIIGETPAGERHAQVKRFQQDEAVRVAVLSVTAAGQGITLTAATSVVFAELHWTPGVLRQAEDRVHRIGQKNAINVTYLVGKGTLDEVLWRTIQRKIDVLSQTLEGRRARKGLGAKDAETTSSSGAVSGSATSAEPSRGESSGRMLREWMDDALADELKDAQDIRSFFDPRGKFFGAKRKKSTTKKHRSRLMGTQATSSGSGDTKATNWDCPRCTLINKGIKCAACGYRPVQTRPSAATATSSTSNANNDQKLADSVPVAKCPLSKSASTSALMFSVSQNTGRISVFKDVNTPLHANFTTSELQERSERLPAVLTSHPAHLRQADRFVRLWGNLRACDRCLLFGIPCQDPARELKKAKQTRKLSTFPKERSTTRFTPATALLAKTAAASPGLVTETVTSKVASHIQVTHKQLHKPDGTPICLACGGDVHQGRRQPSARQGAAASAPRDDWRFCSHACRIEYQTRTGSIVRQRLLQLEKGVCALCGINAHELFMSIRALPPPRRRAVLHDTPGFKGLSWKSMRRLVSAPTEGQFWQADHILAVSEGGGECGIDNYRTLCTPCHQEETNKLRSRLKLAPHAQGTHDIRSFFQSPKSSQKRKATTTPAVSTPNSTLGSTNPLTPITKRQGCALAPAPSEAGSGVHTAKRMRSIRNGTPALSQVATKRKVTVDTSSYPTLVIPTWSEHERNV